ncbi:hypothetical protein B0O95_11290 [Mycetohabitans endofungorum]|uniref:Uncharacterized protein n=1 Tax=Mycetohabitans endofungorum TaxID=417203 RepID=A0A2P5K869_9BURK|nr:hypothetical protein B0O95_11290 [Mycetohabitans endofungorum]
MRIAADLTRQTRRFAVVVLLQLQPVPGRGFHQMLPATFKKAQIGEMRNCLSITVVSTITRLRLDD